MDNLGAFIVIDFILDTAIGTFVYANVFKAMLVSIVFISTSLAVFHYLTKWGVIKSSKTAYGFP